MKELEIEGERFEVAKFIQSNDHDSCSALRRLTAEDLKRFRSVLGADQSLSNERG